MNDRRGASRFWSVLGLAAYCLIFCVIGFLAFELVVRVAAPAINTQGTDEHLVRDDVFGPTRGLAPNVSAMSFGAKVETDARGFVKLPGAPTAYRQSWLVLGDSVTLGVGVSAGSTFPGLLQKDRPDVKIWNTGVLGYTVLDYETVLAALSKDLAFDRVLMFWCLNDVKVHPPPIYPPSVVVQIKIRNFLKTYSKAYGWMKHVFWDRKRDHFRGVVRGYWNEEYLAKTVTAFKNMRDLLQEKGIPMTVFILPYEYQLRKTEAASLLPQEKMGEILTDLEITHYDAQPYLLQHTVDSQALFLTADGLHFSKQGHKLIFDFIRRSLNSE